MPIRRSCADQETTGTLDKRRTRMVAVLLRSSTEIYVDHRMSNHVQSVEAVTIVLKVCVVRAALTTCTGLARNNSPDSLRFCTTLVRHRGKDWGENRQQKRVSHTLHVQVWLETTPQIPCVLHNSCTAQRQRLGKKSTQKRVSHTRTN